MSCWIFAAYGLAALFFIFLLQAALPVRSRFAWMAESDSDMKLAPFPGTKSAKRDALEPSAEEIDLYFKPTRNFSTLGCCICLSPRTVSAALSPT